MFERLALIAALSLWLSEAMPSCRHDGDARQVRDVIKALEEGRTLQDGGWSAVCNMSTYLSDNQPSYVPLMHAIAAYRESLSQLVTV